MITALGGLGLVFNVSHNQKNIRPTDRVAVVGIGGLGHIAIKILNAWGCDVTAISSNAEKENDARMFGASHFLHSRKPNDLKSYPNSFDKKMRD